VSLRTDIRTAFDSVTPATAGMAERVVETARREARVRERRRKFMLRMRVPLPLVAALLVILIIAAVFAGGRLFGAWSAQHTIAPSGTVTGPTLAQLEARPWQHKVLTAGQQCAGNEINGAEAGTNLPIFANPIAGPFPYPWGEYSSGEAGFDQGFSGLMIVRSRDGLTGRNSFWIYDNAGGPVVRTVDIDGQQVDGHAEAVFDLSDPKVKAINGFKTFRMKEAHLAGFSPCFEWQFDGTYQGQPFVWHWYFSG
jgi:hypothetical protein